MIYFEFIAEIREYLIHHWLRDRPDQMHIYMEIIYFKPNNLRLIWIKKFNHNFIVSLTIQVTCISAIILTE